LPKASQKPLPLTKAAWQFAPRQMQTAALENRNRPPPKTHIKRFPNFDEEMVKNVETLSDLVMGAVHQNVNIHEPTIEMKARLVERLSQGKFAAAGVRTKPGGDVELTPIPAQLFKGRPKIKWSEGIVENFNQRYEAVEVQKTRTPVQTNPTPLKTNPKLNSKAGRPRLFEAVKEIAAELHNGDSLRGLSEKARVGLVHRECRSRRPDLFDKAGSPSMTLVRSVLGSLRKTLR
jgi:hypothetical protein